MDTKKNNNIIRIITKPLIKFIQLEQFSGIFLMVNTVAALVIANSAFGDQFLEFWENSLVIGFGTFGFDMSLHHFVNDGLMAVFFLLVGLEIKREVLYGELSNVKQALFPVAGALGGMLIPAAFYLLINLNQSTAHGWGIPMATDIAFALAVISLLGKRVPVSLKIFLTALAIVDDIGAVLVIGVFYTSELSMINLLAAGSVYGLLLLLNMLKIRYLPFYILVGIVFWYFMLQSGVHATLAGVMMAFAIPSKNPFSSQELSIFIKNRFSRFREDVDNESLSVHELTETFDEVSHKVTSPLQRLEDYLHSPVAYFILPLFALANTGVHLNTSVLENLLNPASMGIAAGLLIGKPLGITLFAWISVKLRVANLPAGTGWRDILGVGVAAGIGFTMSIFITLLAFDSPESKEVAKLAILFSSLIAGVAGYLILKKRSLISKNNNTAQ